MDITVSKGNFKDAEARAISSKSYVHRQLIAGALSNDRITVVTNIKSKDMTATAGCLRSMGAVLHDTEEGYGIEEGIRSGNRTVLDCGESGSTARFLMPLAAAFYDEVRLVGHGSLPSRPFRVLCDVLNEHGVTTTSDFLPIGMRGRITSGIYRIPGDVSSQYISGLLFTLPLLSGKESRIELLTPLESGGYVDMTMAVLRSFGIRIEVLPDGFRIPGGQTYGLSPEMGSRLVAEGDWSNSAYLLCMGAVGGRISLTNLNLESIQGDRAILDCLRTMGADVMTGTDSVTVGRRPMTGIDTDVRNIPDLVPALAVAAAFAEKDSCFRNVKRLKIKESDRLSEILKVLSAIGASGHVVDMDDDLDLCVSPIKRAPDYVLIDSANDHRIVMAGVIAAAGLSCPVTIRHAEAIAKSYPGFFDVCRDVLGMDVKSSE